MTSRSRPSSSRTVPASPFTWSTRTRRSATTAKPPTPSGVQRHLVEADVQMPSLEVQEVSRFRVALDSVREGQGNPAAGGRAGGGSPVSAASVDGRDGPGEHHSGRGGSLSDRDGPRGKRLAGPGIGRAPERCRAGGAVAAAGQDELTEWVLQTLRRQAQASLSEAGPPGGARHPTGRSRPRRRGRFRGSTLVQADDVHPQYRQGSQQEVIYPADLRKRRIATDGRAGARITKEACFSSVSRLCHPCHTPRANVRGHAENRRAYAGRSPLGMQPRGRLTSTAPHRWPHPLATAAGIC